MFACEKGHTEIVQKLLSNPSCNVLLKDNVSLSIILYEFYISLWFIGWTDSIQHCIQYWSQ